MTDYKQLCEELADNLHRYQCWYIEDNGYSLHELEALLRRADAALAEAEPKGPTDEALDELFTEIDQSGEPESWRVYARAVLARWGQ